jgi:hypothetical protein
MIAGIGVENALCGEVFTPRLYPFARLQLELDRAGGRNRKMEVSRPVGRVLWPAVTDLG